MGDRSIDMRPQEQSAPIDFVHLDPKAHVYPPVVDEVERADVIVLGPGDLYTSIVPNLLVEGVAEAIRKSPARKAYVCNLMTKHGESDGSKAATFIREMLAYVGSGSVLDCANDADNDGIICPTDAAGDGPKDKWEECEWGTNPAAQESDGDTVKDCKEAADISGDKLVGFVGNVIQEAKFALVANLCKWEAATLSKRGG